MLREGEVYFNNNTSYNLNLFLENYPPLEVSNEEYEEVKIEGRCGSLYINKGTYSDKKIPFTFTFLSENIDINFEKIYTWLTEITENRLVFGRIDRCYKVKKIIFGDFKKEFINIGEFDVTFICEPFIEDLDSTKVNITTNNFKVNCNGNMGAETLFKIYGSGNIQLTVDGETMAINNVSNYVVIDSKLMQVRDNVGNSKDNDTTGNFITLTKGINTISWVGTVTKIELEFTNQYR